MIAARSSAKPERENDGEHEIGSDSENWIESDSKNDREMP